ncbi:glycosyltransferase family 4 protein [Kallotenue papyrolyticum]|uniref:glycosyltransferase family 4 protein n=1 Tax=Kallotenue papyrolyticum TaxID=1325125 RepID=UPI00047852D7|nr:glycosyltransferase family 4 protein [Kallotenue papyrolyticum]
MGALTQRATRHSADRQAASAPLRVLMLARAVFPLHGYGGIERHVFHLVTHLARQDVAVELVVGRPADGDDPEQGLQQLLAAARLSAAPIQLHYLPYDRTSPWLRPNSILGRQINYPLFALAEGALARRLLGAGRIDVVHTQGLCALGFGWERRLRPQLRRIPFIANPHGLEEYRTPDWRKRLAYLPFRALYSWSHRQADRVIATDACTQDDLPHYLGVAPARVAVIPSAIDVEEALGAVDRQTREALRQRLALAEYDPILLSVSRLERNKGYHVLLEALAQARDTLGARWRWLLVGEGKEAAALRAQAAGLGLGEHVCLVGRLSDRELHSLYEEVDLFIHPTLYEGSSLVTLEAMIHRLPVIASAAGGIPDKVLPGRNGLLVPPGDAAALAAAIRSALQRRAEWPHWGAESARIVRTTFDWPIVARRTRQEYQRLLAEKHCGSLA